MKRFIRTLSENTVLKHSVRISISYFSLTRNGSPRYLDSLWIRHVIGIRRNVAEKPDFIDELYTMDQLDEVLPKVDFAVFILPSTPATHHIMDERRLRLMKPGSYLINAGRGDAVDCDALNKVLREGGAVFIDRRLRLFLGIKQPVKTALSLDLLDPCFQSFL